MTRLYRVILIAVFALASSPSTAAEQIRVASDPHAAYTALSITSAGGKLVHIVSRRDGPSGISFSNREVDCGRYLFRYIGDGDSLEEMASSKMNMNFSPLVTGSISDVISSYACRKMGLR